MKKLTIASFTVLGILLGSLSLLAQDKMQKQEKKEIPQKKEMMDKKEIAKGEMMKGYLVDKMCGSGFAKKDKETAMSKAMKHTVSCTLEESCMESGYGLLMDGKYVKFDEAGDKMALDYLKKTKVKENILVEVSGTQEGETIKVKSISEAKAEMMEKKMEKKNETKQEMKKN